MTDYYRDRVEEVFAQLQTRAEGLDAAEAAERLARFGPNLLASPAPIHPLRIFLDQFKSFIIYILLFAVAFSLLIGEYVDTLIILAILLVNAAIGFFQEWRAQRSLDALKAIGTARATVLRGARRQIVDARELVPGDILVLEAGDKVPADARIFEAVRLKAEESALTGESLPSEKQAGVLAGEVPLGDRRNMLYAATALVTGHARAVVTATGMATEVGQIARLLAATVTELTPLQRRLDRFGKRLGYAIIAICIIVFVLGLAREWVAGPLSPQVLINFAFVAISLAVAAVPTGLPAVVTITLSIGVQRLLAKKALVRRLSSVETLGSCDVICTDKTGTLTENQMTVRYAWSLDGEAGLSGVGYAPVGEVSGSAPDELFRCGLVCNNAALAEVEGRWQILGDPTEAALLVSAAKAGVAAEFDRSDEIPFDSERRLMSVEGHHQGERLLFAKGAPGTLLARCSRALQGGREVPLSAELRRSIEKRNADYAAQALRVLAFAMKRLGEGEAAEQELVFLGLQALIDPPRPDVIESLRRTRRAGIRVIMITGDHGETARAIGREIGIVGTVLSGAELEALDEAGLDQALRQQTNIFSRVAPVHKQRIVEQLQRQGHTVAMTGDGVNDAPALKKADIGVAVGSGTDVAKEAADFVLLDDSFTHIVNAIEEGRGIYDNIQKSIMLLLSGNLGEVLIIFLAVLFGLELPLTAILLLWINMVTDGPPALAYSVDPYGRDIMLRPPKSPREGLLTPAKLRLLGVLGSVGTALALVLFARFGGVSGDPEELVRAQTVVFNFVVLYEMVLVFVIRRDYRVPFCANKWVWASAGLSVGLQALLMYTPLAGIFKIVPLGWSELGALAAAGALFGLTAVVYQLGSHRAQRQPTAG